MNVPILIDMAAALAITALLAESYGAVRRHLVGNQMAPVLLGTLFGVMAAVHMHNPIEPYDGLIIDLRNIPVALAGAFLGWRGLVPCLLIAMATRIGIGGIGTVSGLWAMVITGLAGMIWARKMAIFKKRNFGMLLLLAVAMSSHLLAALALPRDLAVWFYTSAAGPILVMNLITVPFIGALLERENQRIFREQMLVRAAKRDPNTGFLKGNAFVREVTSAFAALPLGSFAGVLVVSPQMAGWRSLFPAWSKSDAPEVEANVFSDQLSHWALAGRSADGRILIPISQQEVETVHRLRVSVRKALSNNALDGQMPLYWQVSEIETPDPARFLEVIERAASARQPCWEERKSLARYSTRGETSKSSITRSKLFNPDEHDALFAKADFLIERGQG